MTDGATTPLQPVITADSAPKWPRLCNCCQGDVGGIVLFTFGWIEWPEPGRKHNGGGTSIALCSPCRMRLRALLVADELHIADDDIAAVIAASGEEA